MALPTLAIVAPGAMGAAVGRRLTAAGLTVLTNLDGRSAATRSRAEQAGLKDASLADIASNSNWVLSILPPGEAYNFAKRFRDAHAAAAANRALAFADCNAVNPETVKQISALFSGTPIKFIDAGIIGGPPQGDFDPVFYASSAPEDDSILDELSALSKYGLKVKPLRGEGANVGDASALKMSYAVSRGRIHVGYSQYNPTFAGNDERNHWHFHNHDPRYVLWSTGFHLFIRSIQLHLYFSRTRCFARNFTSSAPRACFLSAYVYPSHRSQCTHHDAQGIPLGGRDGRNLQLRFNGAVKHETAHRRGDVNGGIEQRRGSYTFRPC